LPQAEVRGGTAQLSLTQFGNRGVPSGSPRRRRGLTAVAQIGTSHAGA
jgi:hypothetical protein